MSVESIIKNDNAIFLQIEKEKEIVKKETKYFGGIMKVHNKFSKGYLIIKDKHGEVICSKPTVIIERVFNFSKYVQPL